MPQPKLRENYKATKPTGPVNDDSWRSEIENLTLNDERWTCQIAMIVETRLEDAEYIELFNEAAEEETRPTIFALSYRKLIRGIKLLGKPNSHHGICQFASKQIENEGEASMGPWLLCRLIKFFVNRAKNRCIEILESRTRIEKEITKEIESLGTAGTATRPEKSAKFKGGSGDGKLFDKANTRLRKRGEEWRDKVQINDAPVHGANMYVVLSGFHDPALPTELLDAGLPFTAIFKILRPGEELDISHQKFHRFWSSLETTLQETNTASSYCRVIFQNFCPPELPESTGLDTLKTDAYRRISFLMYDLCDIARHHASYIKQMKLQSGLEEKRPELQVTGTYDAIMSVIPEECASVWIILDALLCQVEGLEVEEKRVDEISGPRRKSETFEERLRSKIDNLNDEFDVFDVSRDEISPGDFNPRLIVHGDDFGSGKHHFSERLAGVLRENSIPDDFGTRVLRQSAIALLWNAVPVLTYDQVEMYAYHIGQLSNCMDVTMDVETTRHFLHLLLFDKMINNQLPQTDKQEEKDLEKNISFPSLKELRLKLNNKRTRSQTICSDKSLLESSRPSFCSDSAIEYGKEMSESFECPELFSLMDTREMLAPGYLPSGKSVSDKNSRVFDLGDFESVQLLSADVFSQVFFACSQQFDAFEARYFAPTDCMLILFCNKSRNEKLSEQQYSASIRTPVCLRDFSSFVMDEEKEWIEKEEELYGKRLAEEGALRKTDTQNPDDFPTAIRYTDADFILQNSIKGTEVRKQKSQQAVIDGTETAHLSEDELPARGKKRGEKAGETNTRKAAIQEIKGPVINPSHKRDESLVTNASFVSLKNTASIQSAQNEKETPTFLGYDIANHKVQVSGFTSEFLADDGTTVKVNLEEWSYAKPRLQIAVELLGHRLVMQSMADGDSPMFHLATSNGIVMGLSILSEIKWRALKPSLGSGQSITKRNYQDEKMGRESETSNGTRSPEMAVDPEFRVSWPSGLVVETLPGDGPSEPFYIKQSYLSKGPECSPILEERQRVFLRDGTIVVFFDDHSVRLMRSNGRVVTCRGIARDQNQREEEKEEEDGDHLQKLRKTRQTTKESIESKLKRKSRINSSEDNAFSRVKTDVKNVENLRIHRTTVLEPDGKLFEIENGEMIVELGQELVRTASDYEVGEKFTRRSDGTNMLIDSQGSLTVSFPDDSRITTGYVIEEDPVSCEWTEEEFHRFYLSSLNAESKSKESILREDGFVSILSTTSMEHKNYATVTYDQSKIDCTLSMPGDVGVRISSDAFIAVTIGAVASLEIKRSEIVFAGRIGTTLESTSSSVFNLGHFASWSMPKTPLLETTDSFGNVFSVDLDGKTSYKKFGMNSDPAEEDESRYSSSSRLPTPRNNPSQSNLRSHRFFAVKRDLSAYEHLHRFDRETQENDKTASIFYRQVNDRGNRKLCTTLTALNPITVSKGWLKSYKVPRIRPTNEDRKDLLRSTYSIPWDYLIPYGKNGPGIRDRTWNLPLRNGPDSSLPKVLLARTIQTIKDRDEDAVKKLQTALGRYWKKAINRFHEYRDAVPPEFRTTEERETEEWLNDFALGRRKTFDMALYFDGLLKISGTQQGLEPRISRRKISGSEDKAGEEEEEEIEWYKNCLRDSTVPCYFDDVTGACFTLILECVNKIGEISDEVK